MERMRVLLANEPRSYREVMAAALLLLRPGCDVITVEPEDLDSVVTRVCPDVVMCSRLTLGVLTNAKSWMLLYPDGGPGAVCSVAGHHWPIAEVEFGAILALIDRTIDLNSLGPGVLANLS